MNRVIAARPVPPTNPLPCGVMHGASLINLPGFSLAPQGLRVPALFRVKKYGQGGSDEQ